MTHRVSSAGATVFSPTGEPMTVLPPGSVVVDGKPDDPGSPAARHLEESKRIRGYEDKAIHPDADKAI